MRFCMLVIFLYNQTQGEEKIHYSLFPEIVILINFRITKCKPILHLVYMIVSRMLIFLLINNEH